MGCFYHPKVESSSACRRCMIPICEACTRERYCPECHKMAMYVRQGHSGARQPNLVVEDNQRRASLTKQLMINRLANNVLADMPGAQQAGSRAGQQARKPAPARRGPVRKSGVPLAPIAASVLALVGAFSLGTAFTRPPAQAVGGAGQAISADAIATRGSAAVAEAPTGTGAEDPDAANGVAAPAPREVSYSYAEVPDHRLGGHDTATMPRRPGQGGTVAEPGQSGLVPGLPRPPRDFAGQAAQGAAQDQAYLAYQAQAAAAEHQGYEPAVPDLPAAPAGAATRQAYAPAGEAVAVVAHANVRPSLSLSWPVAGNTLRMTTYVKVRITNPGQVSVLNVTVDGKPFAPAQSVSSRTEIPVDTTRLPNGDHRIQVMAMTEGGDILTSDAVPVTVQN